MSYIFNYTILSDIFKEHPGYRRGIVVFNEVDNTIQNSELTLLLRESETILRQAITGNPADYPPIAAWREAYRRFGAKPAEYRSSIEALIRRVLKPDTLPDINPLVDIGNLLSLRYMLPAGVHPVSMCLGDIVLRKATEGDLFLADVGRDPEKVNPGEIILVSENRVLTRRWTWRQAADTRTSSDTRFVFFDIDGLPPIGQDDIEAAMADLISLVNKYCGGKCLKRIVLDAEHPTMSI